jgi:hypothetical protein
MKATPAEFQIPESMRLEHAELHEALVEATTAPGTVGEAAREVARLLHPHFVREEQIALPPLGLLEALAQGVVTPEMAAVLPLIDSLEVELPQMLQERRAIRAALENLAAAVLAENQYEYARLAEKILLHAQAEEQVTYPAAILVGEVVRLRLGHHNRAGRSRTGQSGRRRAPARVPVRRSADRARSGVVCRGFARRSTRGWRYRRGGGQHSAEPYPVNAADDGPGHEGDHDDPRPDGQLVPAPWEAVHAEEDQRHAGKPCHGVRDQPPSRAVHHGPQNQHLRKRQNNTEDDAHERGSRILQQCRWLARRGQFGRCSRGVLDQGDHGAGAHAEQPGSPRSQGGGDCPAPNADGGRVPVHDSPLRESHQAPLQGGAEEHGQDRAQDDRRCAGPGLQAPKPQVGDDEGGAQADSFAPAIRDHPSSIEHLRHRATLGNEPRVGSWRNCCRRAATFSLDPELAGSVWGERRFALAAVRPRNDPAGIGTVRSN